MADVTEYKRSDARMAKDWLGLAKRDAAEKNTPKTHEEVRRMQELVNQTEADYQKQLARDARVGAGRGEVNPPIPKADKLAKGGKVSSASKRADGIAQRGKTRGKMY